MHVDAAYAGSQHFCISEVRDKKYKQNFLRKYVGSTKKKKRTPKK